MANGTLPVPGIAAEEVIYATPPPVPVCGSQGCLAVYTLEMSNVGRSIQNVVRIRLRDEPLGTPVVPPTVRRAADVSPAPPATDRAGTTLYPVGRLSPEEHLAVVFVLRAASRETIAPWERILVDVDTTLGGARPGDPRAITAGRLLHALGRVVDRIIRALDTP
jgi:hypothetical protein